MTAKIAIIGTGFRPSGGSIPPVEITEIISDDFTATLFETESNEFPSTPKKRALVEEAYLQTGLKAVADGYDAIFLNTVGDYGLNKLREQLTIPVIGAGETAAKIASLLGNKFSIVTIWPTSLNFIYQDLLSATATLEQCREIRHLSDDDELASLANETNFVTELRSCSIDSVSKLQNAIEEMEQQNNDSIIIGCTCMAPAADSLKKQSIPLLEPMTLGYRFSEYWVANKTEKQPPFDSFIKTHF